MGIAMEIAHLLFIIACEEGQRETKLTSVSKSLLPEKSKQSWFELKKWLFQCLPPIRDYLRDMAVVRLLRLGDADASELGIN